MLPHKDPGVRKAYMKKYHKENDSRINRTRRLKRSLMLNRIKIECGCSHCGYDKNALGLQFHHLDKNNKSFTISGNITHKPLMDLLKETEKCDVLCANCHIIEEHRLNENSLY